MTIITLCVLHLLHRNSNSSAVLHEERGKENITTEAAAAAQTVRRSTYFYPPLPPWSHRCSSGAFYAMQML